MSDFNPGPGWWQASDGKWYSPQQAPPLPPPPTATTQAEIASVTKSTIQPATHDRRRRIIWASAVAVVFAVAAVVFAVAMFTDIGQGNVCTVEAPDRPGCHWPTIPTTVTAKRTLVSTYCTSERRNTSIERTSYLNKTYALWSDGSTKELSYVLSDVPCPK